MKADAVTILTESVIESLRTAIEGNDGAEVSFVGNIDREGLVSEIEAMAYGSYFAVPVDMMETLKGDVVIHNHPSGVLTPSEEDIELSALLANAKIGFYIVDNNCQSVNVVVKPVPRVYLKESEIRGIFEQDGILSECISGFESRKEQTVLVNHISESINESAVLMSEAGTGTGKSLSYLIPAAVWAMQNKKRVLVTTHTINLQNQIAGKDMIIVNQVIDRYLGKPVDFAVIVGKNNYLCRKKLYDLIRDKDYQKTLFDSSGDFDMLTILEEWSRNAVDGTRSEFGQIVREELWEEVATDGMTCDRKRCPYYSECFYFIARLRAERSNLIICNHSLLLSSIDRETYQSYLPFYSGVVFDEAHHLEDVALRSLSREFSFQGILYNLRKLFQKRNERDMGLLPSLRKRSGIDSRPGQRERYQTIVESVQQAAQMTQDMLNSLLATLKEQPLDSNTIGIDVEFKKTELYETFYTQLNGLFQRLGKLSIEFKKLSESIKETATDERAVDLMKLVEMRLTGFDEAGNAFVDIFESGSEMEIVRWMEIGQRNIRFSIAPLEVGDFLANALFSRKDFTIFTSATLVINKKFDYFKSCVGLNLVMEKQKREVILLSPFDYKKQAEIYILEEPLDHREVSKEKTDLIRELCLLSEGGVLVLFTSYLRLKEMFEKLKDVLMENGILPLRQGEKSREELLSIMKSRSYAALFATSSFWEGIDVQGDNLRAVVIEKIPFDNPSDPIYKAKVALLESRELNAFLLYSVPRAVLRLKQGLGRLIRSKTDKGIIALLDNRFKTKSYGSIFLNSLPPAKVIFGESKTIMTEAERFLSARFTRSRKALKE